MDTNNSNMSNNSRSSYFTNNNRSKKIYIRDKNCDPNQSYYNNYKPKNNCSWQNNNTYSNISKSWNNSHNITHFKPKTNYSSSFKDELFQKKYNGINSKEYNAINNCRSAGIIPYCIHENKLYFLLQQTKHPVKKKLMGWNDFGGKQIDKWESTANTAAREFSEETSCLFYLNENKNEKHDEYYNMLKNNNSVNYNDDHATVLKQLIPESQKFYHDKITEFIIPIHASSKETYITYFVNVGYIPESDLPQAEDIHIDYDFRYIRECKWFTIDEINSLSDNEFHKRLQITKIKQRIQNYLAKDMFI